MMGFKKEGEQDLQVSLHGAFMRSWFILRTT